MFLVFKAVLFQDLLDLLSGLAGIVAVFPGVPEHDFTVAKL